VADAFLYLVIFRMKNTQKIVLKTQKIFENDLENLENKINYINFLFFQKSIDDFEKT
jgi:hypothetical protein